MPPADGVAVGDVNVTAGSARLGRFELRDLALSYADAGGTAHFEGQGTLVLPSPLSPTVTARLGFGVGDGYFHAGGEVAGLNRPLAYGVFLQRIRFDITINPVRLSGGIGVSAGPRLFGTEAVSVDGDFTYEESNPDRYTINGSARIVDIPLASGSVAYQTDGRFDMIGQATFNKFGVGFDGSLQGWVDGGNAFNFQGNGSVRAGIFKNGGDAVVSSSGAAACRHGFGPDVGFGYGWGSNVPHIFASSCNVGDWVVDNSIRQAGPPTFGSFAIAPGQPVSVFSVVGTLAPPRAILTGPDGATGRRNAGRSARRDRRRPNPPVPEPGRPDDVHRGQGPGGRAVPHVAEAGLTSGERLPLGAVARPTAAARAGRGRRAVAGRFAGASPPRPGARWCSTSRAVTPAASSRRRRSVEAASPSPCPMAGRVAARSSPCSARTG